MNCVMNSDSDTDTPAMLDFNVHFIPSMPKANPAAASRLRNRDLNSFYLPAPKTSKLVKAKYDHEQERTDLYWRHQGELSNLEARQKSEMAQMDEEHDKKIASLEKASAKSSVVCKECKSSVKHDDSFACDKCRFSFCNIHKTGMTECVSCHKTYCTPCLELIKKCAGHAIPICPKCTRSEDCEGCGRENQYGAI